MGAKAEHDESGNMRGHGKRLFSSERRMLERKGIVTGEHAVADGAPVSSAEIARLFSEIKELKTLVQRQGRRGPRRTDKPEMADLHEQLNDLGDHIYEMKKEIASIRQVGGDEDRLTVAALELDAIVESTEQATHRILNAAEEIGELLDIIKDRIDDVGAQALIDESVGKIVDILEACNFQDICGQRTNKVINTIQYLEDRIIFIEKRIASMITVWGKEDFEDFVYAEELQDDADAALLHGPQHKEKAIDQADIDAMFES